MTAPVIFDGVWKKFRRGERHDSLRDLVPSVLRRALGSKRSSVLQQQEFWALRDVSFQVAPGEALGIIGPNGAGKSTTLKLLTRILKPTRGSCVVNGRLGALIEVAAGFHPDLTGRENIFLQGAIMGMKRNEIASRFDEIIEFAGIHAFVDTPVKRYSSGMNARLGFSIAAHLHPEVLIIDEALAVGDIAFQRKCFTRMRQFLSAGVAIVFVSHNLAAVSELCRRALLLNSGDMVATGSVTEVIAAYCAQQAGKGGAQAHQAVQLTATLPHRPAGDVWFVSPGTPIRIDVELTCLRHVDTSNIGIVIWDIARDLDVYGANSDALGVGVVKGEPGERLAFRFEFATNLARGTYAVEIHVWDTARQEHLSVLRPAAQFTVVEDITYTGVANLFLSGRRVEATELV